FTSTTSILPTLVRPSLAIRLMSSSSSIIKIFIRYSPFPLRSLRLSNLGVDGFCCIVFFTVHFNRPTRNPEPKDAAFTFFALDSDRPFMPFDYRLTDCQAQSGSAFLSRIRSLYLTESFEYNVSVFCGYSPSMINHFNFDPFETLFSGDFN